MASFEVVIVGCGMCGISCAAGLKQFGVQDFIILEKGPTINHFWKNLTYDRMSLHTPWHDLPHDGGLVYKYPMLKNKHQLTDYLHKYASKFKINSHIKFNKEVININKKTINNKPKWIITTKDNSKYISDSLCIATSMFTVPKIPSSLLSTINNFNNGKDIVHSMQYKNGSKYKNKNVLIVGNGNSAFEIAVDLVQHNANKVTMVSRSGRYCISLSDLKSGVFEYATILKHLGITDQIMSRNFTMTPKHEKYNPVKFAKLHNGIGTLANDLSEYGLHKPKESVFEATVSGLLPVFDWPQPDSGIELIKTKRVGYIESEVVRFSKPNIIHLKKDNMELKDYDVVILCTGYDHGLECVFEEKLYNELFEESNIGKRWKIVPKTNGLNQSTVDDTVYFVGILGDLSIFGGTANGYWGWNVARNIAKQKGNYSRNKELSIWNSHTASTAVVAVASVGTVICAAGYVGYKAYEKYKEYCRKAK